MRWALRSRRRIDDQTYVDVSDLVDDFGEEFFGGGGWSASARPSSGRRGTWSDLRGEDRAQSLGHQILCVGLNYSDHAAETGQAVPQEPILFTKSPNTLIGPNDDVRIPRGSTKPDWEVELGIGAVPGYLDSVDEALDSIAGYLVVNDVSERAFQMERGGQWSKGKSAETSTRPDRGWSRPMRSTTFLTWTCGWTSTALDGKAATPRR